MSRGSGAGSGRGPGGAGVKDKDRSFCQFLATLPEDRKLFRLFERDNGSYFTAYRGSAEFIADEFYHTQSVLKQIGPSTSLVSSVYLSCKMFRTVVKSLLLEFRCRVEVWSGSGATWTVTKAATPGNVNAFRDFVLSEGADDTVAVLSVAVKRVDGIVTVGAALASTTYRTVDVYEFIDPGFTLLEGVALQGNARESIVVNAASGDARKLASLLGRVGVAVMPKPASLFDTKDAASLLTRVFKPRSEGKSGSVASKSGFACETKASTLASGPTFESSLDDVQSLALATAAVVAVARHLKLSTSKDSGTYTLRVRSLAKHMRLNASSLQALQLFPRSLRKPGVGGSKSTRSGPRSLFDALNRCRTPMGVRTLRRYIKQPSTDRTEIVTRHRIVQLLYTNAVCRQQLRSEHLRRMPDLERLSEQFERCSGTLADLLSVYRAAISLEGVTETLADLDADARPVDAATPSVVASRFITPLDRSCRALLKLRALVEETIDIDSRKYHRRYMIRPSYHPDLLALSKRVLGAEEAVEAAAAAIASLLKMKREKLRVERHNLLYGACCRIPKSRQRILQGKAGIVRLSVQSGGVYFTSAALQAASGEYHAALGTYQEAQEAVAKQVMDVAFTYSPVMAQAGRVLSELDVLASFAAVAAEAPSAYCCPDMSSDEDRVLDVTAARHPCVELQDGLEFIANDVSLRGSGPRLLLVTGPNMGGKSTYIRTVALVAVLAQIGSFVPAESATLPIFDCILARVGASDSMLGGVSTFMSEMLETSAMLRTATPRSLLIIDELGRGTSTYDGFGIAWAVAQHLATHVQCMALFATHFHELTEMASRPDAHSDSAAARRDLPMDERTAKRRRLLPGASVPGTGGGSASGGSAGAGAGCGAGADAEAELGSGVAIDGTGDRPNLAVLVKNCQVTAHCTDDSITMLYEVKPGVCDRSFGIHVAALAGMPPELLADARRKAAELAAEAGPSP